MINRTIHKIRFIFTDLLAACLAWLIFCALQAYPLQDQGGAFSGMVLFQATLAGLFWTGLYALAGAYYQIFRQSRLREILVLARLSFFTGLFIYFGLLLLDQAGQRYQAYYPSLATYFGIHLLVSALAKTLILSWHHALVRTGKVRFNTLLVGGSERARELYEDLNKNSRLLGFQVLGYVEAGQAGEPALSHQLPRLGTYLQLPALIARYQVEEVVVALEASEHRQIEAILGMLEGSPVRVNILPDMYQILLGAVRVNYLFGTPLIQVRQQLLPVWQALSKRAGDIFVSLLVLVLFSPLFLVIGLLVKLSSPGPMLYCQERIGKDGMPFLIYKFRSMYADAEKNGPALSCDQDPRVTPWGRIMRKVHLDELPQFYNVLLGHMALVGPRPERQYFIDLILEEAPHYKHLLRVRPGITSLGLVKFGYAQNVAEMIRRLRYDIIYIENMSLAMDFRVMLYTIKVIIEGRGK